MTWTPSAHSRRKITSSSTALEASSVAWQTCGKAGLAISLFPDYAVSHQDILCDGELVLLTGTACGMLAVAGQLPKENHWEIPAAWKAVVRGGQIAEWHVYADNQPARKVMGDRNP